MRLARWSEGRFTGETGFFLIGFIEVESIFRASAHPAGATTPARYAPNAHVRRAMNDSQYWDGFWVFAGSERSTRFPPGRASRPRLCKPGTPNRVRATVRLVDEKD